MNDEISIEFSRKEKRLIELCAEIAGILRQSKRNLETEAEALERTSCDLRIAQSIEEKRGIISTIKSLFHKEGISDWGPPGMKWEDWNAKTDELFDLIWIYQEARYSQFWGK